MTSSPIFVVGMPRSGTTLMSSAIAAHPRLTISPETHFLTKWVYRRGGRDIVRPADFDRFWEAWSASERFGHLGIDAGSTRGRIEAAGPITYRSIFDACMQAYAEAVGKVRWGEKTPDHFRYVDLLCDWYPDCRIIFMVRDPRAVAASTLKTPWGTRSIDVIAHKWNRVARLIESHAGDRRYMVVRYRDLVVDPETTLRRVCDHIGEDYAPEMLEQRSQASERVARRSGWQKEQVLKSQGPINTSSLDKWRDQLTSQQVQIVEHLTRRHRTRLGFEDTAASPPLATRVHLAIRATRQLVYRLAVHVRRRFFASSEWL